MRNKKRFAAQARVTAWAVLAQNVLLGARSWLAPAAPRVTRFGLTRRVRDVWGIRGRIAQTREGRICRIVLNQANHWAHQLVPAFARLVQPEQVVVSLGET